MDVKEELEKRAKTVRPTGGGKSRAAGKGDQAEQPVSFRSETEPSPMESERKEAGKESGSSPKSAEKMALIREETILEEKNPQLEAGMIRLLKADEIECRVSTVNEKGVSLLLYKDARVDQKILDETFTPFGWRRTHQSIDGGDPALDLVCL